MNTGLPARRVTKGSLAHRLAAHARHAKGALSANTERALRADSAIFTAWCVERGVSALPATHATVAEFIDAMAAAKVTATIRRYASSIAALHRAAGLDSPTAMVEVRMALRRLGRSKGTRQQQATPLNRTAVDQMIASASGRLIEQRDVALLAVAYDTLARRSELAALNVDDVHFADDGTGTALIRRSKTDQEGAGAVRFLATDTVAVLRQWLGTAGISDGALFRAVSKGGRLGGRIESGQVARIFQRMAARAGLTAHRVSGHSTRVGAAQDMIACGLEIGEVMQAGGWRTPVMVARYTERLSARRGAAAKLAVLQKRMGDLQRSTTDPGSRPSHQ